MKKTGIYESWKYLVNHPLFGNGSADRLMKCLRINIIKGNPEMKDGFGFFEVVGDDEAGTEQVWIECGPYSEGKWLHDSHLDTAAESFEEGIQQLAEKISETYGAVKEESSDKTTDHKHQERARQ